MATDIGSGVLIVQDYSSAENGVVIFSKIFSQKHIEAISRKF
jgi:hypothetical protein